MDLLQLALFLLILLCLLLGAGLWIAMSLTAVGLVAMSLVHPSPGLFLAWLFAVVLRDTPLALPPSGRLSSGLAIQSIPEAWGLTGVDGLAMLIGYTDGFECTGKYSSMEEALASIRHRMPDVVLSDIGLPGMDGIEGVKILKEKYPNLTIRARNGYYAQ